MKILLWVADSARDRRFLVILLVFFVGVMASRVKGKPIELPEAAHNTVGDMPMAEQFDDGYVSPVQSEPKDINSYPTTRNILSYSGSIVSGSTFFYINGNN